jgi:hypothetical protein
MALVSSLPYYKVKVTVPLGSPSNYSSPAPIAYVNRGRWFIEYAYALVTNPASSMTFNYTYVIQGTPGNITVNPGVLTTLIVVSLRNNCQTVGGGGVAVPATVYRTLSNVVDIPADNTPLWLAFGNTTAGGASFSTSISPDDADLNYLHFIKVA